MVWLTLVSALVYKANAVGGGYRVKDNILKLGILGSKISISLSYLLPQKNPCVKNRKIQITSTTKRPTLSQSKKIKDIEKE